MFEQYFEDLPGARSVSRHAGVRPRVVEHRPPTGQHDTSCEDLLSAVRRFHEATSSWHHNAPDTSPTRRGIGDKALHLHAMNFALWHHEDAVRRPTADDHEVARRKRSIDDVNARRNAAIEDIDDTLFDRLDQIQNRTAPLHTETPGMIVDRLSVLTLRIAHTDRLAAASRLAVLDEQYRDLAAGLDWFLARMLAGELRFKRYQQFKSAEQRTYCDLFGGLNQESDAI